VSAALPGREATRRAVATVCLAGIALVQAIELPALVARDARLAVLSLAAVALCVGSGLALAVASPSASSGAWRVVGATAVLVLIGWALPHAVSLPPLAGARGDWAALPGVACAGLAAACLMPAAAAAAPSRAALSGLATALAVLVALGPGVGALLVAVGPGPRGGEAAIAAGAHVHAIPSEEDIRLRPGRTGNHYVTRVPARPQTPPVGIALVVAAAGTFAGGAVGYLRRRTGPARA
jgi:hypothetical protein